MKKKVIIGIVVFLVAIYGLGVLYFSNNIIFNTTMYQQKINGLDKSSLDDILNKQSINLKVKDKRKNIEISLEQLDYNITNISTIKDDIVKKQNAFLWPYLIISSQNIDAVVIEVDKKELYKIMDSEIIKNKGLKESKSAYFDLADDDKVSVVKEVVGEQLDQKLVYDKIVAELSKGNLKIDLTHSIIKPTVVASELEKTIKEVDVKLNNEIKIKVDGVNYTINPSKKDKLGWLNVDYKNNKVTIEKKAILNYLKNINSEFIKDGNDGKTIYTINNGVSTLKQKGKAVLGIDEYETSAIIYNVMKNNQSVDKTIKAVTVSQPKVTYEGIDSIDDNLVEVSIAKQKLYLYSKGKLILTADIVTGKPNGDTDTPKGKYKVLYKTKNFTLKGEDYGYDYELPVSYWIPLENGGGVGLHDAPWRSNGSFGGSLYLADGSHGCINMRLSDVAKVYDNVVAGTAIWVH